MRLLLVLAALVMLSSSSRAQDRPVLLKRAPGAEVAEARCAACHSLDYIVMNSPFLDRQQWQAEVAKMIDVFGAPIDEPDAKAIVDYLTRNYGVEAPPR
jgi:mono/diheme cytochrome c family protein